MGRLKGIVETAVDSIITIDEQGSIASLNPAAVRLFGYLPAEVIGQNVKLLMPATYHDEHDGYLNNYLKTGVKKIIGIGREVVGRRRDGQSFPIELSVSETMVGTRRIFTGIVRDISDRKRQEQLRRDRDLAEQANGAKSQFLANMSHELQARRQAAASRPGRRIRSSAWCAESIAVFARSRDDGSNRLGAACVTPAGSGQILCVELDLDHSLLKRLQDARHQADSDSVAELHVLKAQAGDLPEHRLAIRMPVGTPRCGQGQGCFTSGGGRRSLAQLS